eukprot:COSAG02_NODE_7938_length_2777_cov_255.124478_1_plen_603_part_10
MLIKKTTKECNDLIPDKITCELPNELACRKWRDVLEKNIKYARKKREDPDIQLQPGEKVLSCSDGSSWADPTAGLKSLLVWDLDGETAGQCNVLDQLQSGSDPSAIKHFRACSVYDDHSDRNGLDWKALTCGADFTIKIWDLMKLRHLDTIEDAHENWVMSCDIICHEFYYEAVTCSSDNTVKLWDLRLLDNEGTGAHTKNLKGSYKVRKSLWQEQEPATTSFWLEQGPIAMRGHEDWVMGCKAYKSDDGSWKVLTSSADFKLKIWALTTRKCVRTLIGHTDWINTCSVYEQNAAESETAGVKVMGVSGSDDHTVRVWQLSGPQAGDCKMILRGHEGIVIQVQPFVQNDRQMVASCSADKTVRIWSLATGECELIFNEPDRIRGLAISEDNSRIMTCSKDGSLRLWDLHASADKQIMRKHTQKVVACEVFQIASTQGHIQTFLISCARDKAAYLWDLSKGQWNQQLTCKKSEREAEHPRSTSLERGAEFNITSCCAFKHPKHDWMVLCGTDCGLVLFEIDVASANRQVQPYPTILKDTNRPSGRKFFSCTVFNTDKDGLKAISGTTDGIVYIWDLTDLKPEIAAEEKLRLHNEDVLACCAYRQ